MHADARDAPAVAGRPARARPRLQHPCGQGGGGRRPVFAAPHAQRPPAGPAGCGHGGGAGGGGRGAGPRRCLGARDHGRTHACAAGRAAGAHWVRPRARWVPLLGGRAGGQLHHACGGGAEGGGGGSRSGLGLVPGVSRCWAARWVGGLLHLAVLRGRGRETERVEEGGSRGSLCLVPDRVARQWWRPLASSAPQRQNA
jgi:hypothetical protein